MKSESIFRTWAQSALPLLNFFQQLDRVNTSNTLFVIFFLTTLLLCQLLVIDRAYDWRKSPKVVALSLKVHCLTGSGKTAKLFHRSWTRTSYGVVTKQINSFSSEVHDNINIAAKIIYKGHPTHVTIDNSDGQQQSLTH